MAPAAGGTEVTGAEGSGFSLFANGLKGFQVFLLVSMVWAEQLRIMVCGGLSIITATSFLAQTNDESPHPPHHPSPRRPRRAVRFPTPV